MRKILKQREVIADTWRYADEASSATQVIYSLEQLLAERDALFASGKAIGVKLKPTDKVEALAGLAPQLKLIALEFGGLGEGRGYSQAHILRRRLGFTGELRAVGNIQRDQLFYMARCGFDAFELPAEADLQVALTGFNDYSVAYQPGIDSAIKLAQRATAS